MNTLVVATFNHPEKAEDVRGVLLKKAGEAVAPEEAVAVVVDENKNVRVGEIGRLTAPTALGGGFVGTLAGLMVFNPALALVGGVTGTALGAILGTLEEVGIDEDFMKNLASELKPGSSALFVRPRTDDPVEIVNLLEPYSEKTLRASLSHADENRLKKSLGEEE